MWGGGSDEKWYDTFYFSELEKKENYKIKYVFFDTNLAELSPQFFLFYLSNSSLCRVFLSRQKKSLEKSVILQGGLIKCKENVRRWGGSENPKEIVWYHIWTAPKQKYSKSKENLFNSSCFKCCKSEKLHKSIVSEYRP